MSFNVKITDNSEAFIDEARRKALTAVTEAAEFVVSEAKRNCPVDTGRLRDSIEYSSGTEFETAAANIGSDVEYAVDVELKSIAHRNGKAHFLRDAIQDNRNKIHNIIEAAMKN